ncbi:rod shape-determining protein MreC [Bacteroides propionicifaciens]|uniref:rod shape-determining protein MreC n=1 Tax=Bacteroides propionicifaciens TaxID=392838 RepID=UPI00035C3F26|nr:rod shape-determining protein MreC [Bacteroides propionicifaciens]
MRKLLQFLHQYNYWFLFIILEVTSFILIFKYNNYQHSVYLTSANTATGKMYEWKSTVTSYFHLKSINEDLLDRNIELEKKIANLQATIREEYSLEEDHRLLDDVVTSKYKFFKAHVVQNSLNSANNFITLDKGSLDGIRPEMGVIDGNGVVGIVYKTSPHYSWVMSLLNTKSNISCKIAGNNYFGNLTWEYGDVGYAYLRDLPRHATFSLGDTIVTSGFSAIFPEGILVGTIDDMSDIDDGFSFYLKVKLSVDFGKLDGVRVIENEDLMERKQLGED